MTLSSILKNTPQTAGVYLFKNKNGEIIYIGKANNLRQRIRSYTSQKIDRPWVAVMIKQIDQVETIAVNSEVEALLLELNLIKCHQPRYNIRLIDDKNYSYIKYCHNEKIPRFLITRRIKNDDAEYFGPYLSARLGRSVLELLQSIYGVHISVKKLGLGSNRPCFACQLSGLNCPIFDENSIDDYRKRCGDAVMILKGRNPELTKKIHQAMRQAAKEERFELAAKLRDKLDSLTTIAKKQSVVSTKTRSYLTLGIATDQELISIAVLLIDQGRLIDQKHYFFKLSAFDLFDQAEILSQFIAQHLINQAGSQKEIDLPCRLKDEDALIRLFAEKTGVKIKFHFPVRGQRKATSRLAELNARNKLDLETIKIPLKRKNQIELQQNLGLDFLPSRIEAVDISNLAASEAAGATVCFIDGQATKDEYRRYQIKTVTGQNDLAMIQEIVRRRFNDSSRQPPDIFLVDGGLEHLKKAIQALKTTATQPKIVVSLAKNPDRVFIPGQKLPKLIGRKDNGLRILAEVRDEAHRFGRAYLRKRQIKKSLQVESEVIS